MGPSNPGGNRQKRLNPSTESTGRVDQARGFGLCSGSVPAQTPVPSCAGLSMDCVSWHLTWHDSWMLHKNEGSSSAIHFSATALPHAIAQPHRDVQPVLAFAHTLIICGGPLFLFSTPSPLLFSSPPPPNHSPPLSGQAVAGLDTDTGSRPRQRLLLLKAPPAGAAPPSISPSVRPSPPFRCPFLTSISPGWPTPPPTPPTPH